MFNFGFTIGQYYPVNSLIHRIDPRVKLLLVIAYAFAIFLIQNFTGFAFAALITGVLVVLGRLPVRLIIRGLKPILYILVFTFLIHLWTGGGPWIDLGIISISEAGLITGALIGIRLVLLIVGASLLTLTSTPIELTDGIESILAPLKRIRVPVHEIAMMVTIALRFIPTLAVEADKIIKAQSSRGAKFDSGNPVIKAKSFIPVLVPLFLSVFRRADELAEAMEARAYRGGQGRTRMRRLEMGMRDIVAFVVMAILLICVAWIGRLPAI